MGINEIDLRRGSVRDRELTRYFFPFDAFEFDDPHEDSTPTLTLTTPWDMELKGKLILEPASNDDELIRIESSTESGETGKSIVAEEEATSVVRRGWLKVNVQDSGNQLTDGDYFIPIFSIT